MVYKFFDKKSKGYDIKFMPNQNDLYLMNFINQLLGN